MNDERVYITKDKAIEMMVDGDRVHTFRSGTGALLGADWDREKLLKHIDKYPAELAGGMATRMNHALVLIDDNGPLFIATK